MEKTLNLIVDGGGTKLKAILFYSNGEIIKNKRLDMNSNTTLSGGSEATTVLADNLIALIKEICAERFDEVYSITFTIANYDYALENLLAPALKNKRVEFSGDAYSAFFACFGGKGGVCLCSGTGSFALYSSTPSLNKKDYACMGGWGTLDEDLGSGYFVGITALRSLLYAIDDQKFSPLHIAILKKLGFDEKVDRYHFCNFLYSSLSRRDIAQLSHVVAKCAKEGESESVDIYSRCAHYLADYANRLYNLKVKSGLCPVSLVGGMVNAGDILLKPLKERLSVLNENLVYTEPLFQNYVGSILVAIKTLGLEIDEGILQKLKNTAYLAE